MKNTSLVSPGIVSQKSKKPPIDEDGSQYCNLESVEVSMKSQNFTINSGESRSDIEEVEIEIRNSDLKPKGSDDEGDDYICVPLSNIDKDTMTFKNREQLLRESLMMSEVEQRVSARPGTSEIRSMVFMAGNQKPVEEEKSDAESQSQISVDFEPEPVQKETEEDKEEKPNKKEMQAVKYVSGGTLVKKNLFSSWLNIYENEANFFGH